MCGKSATPHPDTLIARLAERQHGVVSHRLLLAIGVSRRAIENRLRNRRLHRVHRGVYILGPALASAEAGWLAGVLACGPGAVVSHRSAAALGGIRRSSAARVDVTVAGTSGRTRRAGLSIHRTRRLTRQEVTARSGIPVTSVARTILDLGPHATKAIEEAERLQLFDLTALQAVLRMNPGRAGIDLNVEPALVRNDLERDFLRLCRRHGLPTPRVNTPVGDYEPDFYWPERRLIVETDGRETHATRAAFESDRARDAELTANGYRVVRFTWRQLQDEPDRIAELLRRLLG